MTLSALFSLWVIGWNPIRIT